MKSASVTECGSIVLRQPLARLGMAVSETDRVPAMRSGMKMVHGVIVTLVQDGSLADWAGVARGDIISEADGRSVRTVVDLKRLLDTHNWSEPVSLLFRREGATRFLAISCKD